MAIYQLGTATVTDSLGALIGSATLSPGKKRSHHHAGSDTGAIKSRAGHAVTAANFKFDFNAAGVSSAADIAAAKVRSSGVLIS